MSRLVHSEVAGKYILLHVAQIETLLVELEGPVSGIY